MKNCEVKHNLSLHWGNLVIGFLCVLCPAVAGVNLYADNWSETAFTSGTFSNTTTTIGSADIKLEHSPIDCGNGADGAITVVAAKNINTDIFNRASADAVNTTSTVNTLGGDTAIVVTSVPAGMAVGDEIIIISLKGTSGNVGRYEFARITSVNVNTLNLNRALTNGYNGTLDKIMVQRVPNYTNVTVNAGGSLTCSVWDGTKGGVLVFRATSTVTVNVANGIHTNGCGFTGGGGGGSWNNGSVGESPAGIGGGAGGGGAHLYGDPGTATAGGGGNGTNPASEIILNQLSYLGAGGGGGGGAVAEDGDYYCAAAGGGSGGRGGGMVIIAADTLDIVAGASVCANGGGGAGGGSSWNGDYHAVGGSGGSGAGGSIVFLSNQITNSGGVSANGGGRTHAQYISFSGNNPVPNYYGTVVPYKNPGLYTSIAITPAGVAYWGILGYTRTIPANTILTVDVLSSSNNSLLQANVPYGTCLSAAYPATFTNIIGIKLRANFSTSDTTQTPSLSDWSVDYYNNTEILVTTTNWTSLTNGNAPVQMGQSIAFVKFNAATISGTAKWKRFRIDKGVTGVNTPCPDNKIEIQVWCDNDNNGFWSVNDTFIAKGNFTNGTCYLNMRQWQVTTTSKTYYIVYKLANDIGGGQRAGVEIADSSYLEFENAACVGIPP
ncbi:MAG: hypothetical protein HY811_05075 [Planctomycetes bacterium]|nr:hypothetical protein [Planctomycetota bacterium]